MKIIKIIITSLSTFVTDENKDVYEYDDSLLSVARISNFKSVICSGNYVYGIDIHGDAYYLESEMFVKINYNFKKIISGYSHMFAFDMDDKLYAWGSNGSGQLGMRTPYPHKVVNPTILTFNFKKIICGGWHTFAADINDNWYGFGENMRFQLFDLQDRLYCDDPTRLNIKFIKLAAGNSYSLGIDNNGNVLSCGDNCHGQLGIKSKTDREHTHILKNKFKKVYCMVSDSFALDLYNDIYAWGKNFASFPIKIGFKAKSLYPNHRNMSVIDFNGEVYEYALQKKIFIKTSFVMVSKIYIARIKLMKTRLIKQLITNEVVDVIFF